MNLFVVKQKKILQVFWTLIDAGDDSSNITQSDDTWIACRVEDTGFNEIPFLLKPGYQPPRDLMANFMPYTIAMSQQKRMRSETSSDHKVWKKWLDELLDEEEESTSEESDSDEIDHLSESEHNTDSE
ncbi:Protein of unknown function [Gryllus bimaculatus]|nr:Protein of unknown function [Gryllus bimaculatus]